LFYSISNITQVVGTIIGRTGAEAMKSMLGWLTQALSDQERGEFLESLKLASRYTMFDRWLNATFEEEVPGTGAGGGKGDKAGSGKGEGGGEEEGEEGEGEEAEEDPVKPLEELAEYLSSQCPSAVPAVLPDPSGVVEDSTKYR
jgi:hypothetical protein